jgi:hypothetical protein
MATSARVMLKSHNLMMDDPSIDICSPLNFTMDEATVEERPRVQLMRKDSAEVIAAEMRRSGISWAWVDGFSQAGKSVLATRLAHALGWERVVYLDHMALESGKQPLDSTKYSDHLDRDRIRDAITSGPHAVVEGVCLRDVVDGMRRDAALRIYIARVSRPGTGSLIWHDGLEMLEPESRKDGVNWLSLDIVDYHRRTRPHANSDYVLVRIEGSEG